MPAPEERCYLSMELSSQMLPRILRDVNDGVIVLDGQGTVLYVNPSGQEMLLLPEDAAGRKYAALMQEDIASRNDEFNQFLLDAIYDKQSAHRGECAYLRRDGTRLQLHMVTSFLRDDAGQKNEGVVIQFTDITELARMHQKEKDASIVFVSTLIFVCAWVLLVALWEFLDRPLPAHLLTQAVTFLGACMMVFLVRTTSITWRELGLSTKNLRKVLITDSLVAAAGLALMIGLKFVLLRVAPGFFEAGTPFWNWRALRLSGVFYPVTVFLQELISRGLMHESMRRIITGKYRELAAIAVTSLAFGALHLFLGLIYMLGAVILLGGLGVLYRRQNTIWGLCIPHYVLGMALVFLGFA